MEVVGVSLKGMDANLYQDIREGGKITLNKMGGREEGET